MRLAGRTAVITGAASGIGLSTAKLLMDEGARVFGVDLQPFPDELTERPEFAGIGLDLTAPAAETAAFTACEEAFGPADILFNNAGIGNSRSILETDDESLERFLAVNLAAPFRMARAAITVMRRRGGVIVNTASIYGLRGAAGSSAYSATKAAVIGMTQQLAVEYGRDGIRVNAIAPGLILTPMSARRLESNPWFREQMAGRTPLGYAGTPADIAEACLFLASDAARFITGVTLPVDGGWTAAGYMPDPR